MTLGARWTFKEYWMRGWMHFAGRGPLGRFATRLATWFAPPFYKRNRMAFFSRKGYIAPSAEIDHSSLTLGVHSYIGERVKIIEEPGGRGIEIGDEVRLHWDITLHTGQGGTISIGPRSSVQPGCQFEAYVGSIRVGSDVHIGSNCAFYPFNHGFAPGILIADQSLTSRGDIVLEDGVNLGHGVIVVDGVTIGKGAVVGAGSVVVQDIPPGAIAMGVPARVLRMRSELEPGLNGKDGTIRLSTEIETLTRSARVP
jgi:acetyltransferase-like isoleucine patch superfamily enzyme